MGDALVVRGGSVLADGRFERMDLLIASGRLARLAEPGADFGSGPADVLDAAGLSILPGFIDAHTHGGAGVDFNRCSASDVRSVCSFFASRGVTAFLPTVCADAEDAMLRQLRLLSDPALRAGCPQILGMHLEGPFLSPAYKGAMREASLRPCSARLYDEFRSAGRDAIRLVTLAPELPGAVDLIAGIVETGARVSLGHSGASYEDAMAAIAAGATSATHTMNAMKQLHMHDPGILAAVLESDVYAEMICDGFHLHPAIVRLLLKAKGPERMIAVSDSMMAAGLPDGAYSIGGQDVVVENGDARLRDRGARAGSTLTMIGAARNIGEFTGLGLESISRLVSENPARMLGVFGETGSIAEGKRADLVLLDGERSIAATVVGGQIVYRAGAEEGV